jgi:hypothetical protein
MGADEEVFATVDALFTAVTARDATLLRRSEERLRSLAEGGKLSAKARGYLDGIVSDARGGEWGPAAERLYGFLLAPRRVGTPERRPASARGRGGRAGS